MKFHYFFVFLFAILILSCSDEEIITPDVNSKIIDDSVKVIPTNEVLSQMTESNDENELEIALKSGAEIIGINNRDLRTFDTRLETTSDLANMVPRETILVSESGFENKIEIDSVKKYGVNAVLVGESLVVSDDPGKKLRELL